METLAKFMGFDPDFFDKLNYIFNKFEDGYNIKEFVTLNGTNYFVRLNSEDGKIEEIPV